MKNKSAMIVAATVLSLGVLHAEETVSALSNAAVLKSLDTFAIGDPLLKAPLSIGDDKAAGEGKGEDGVKADKKAKGPTEITANDADFDNRTHKAVFYNDVVVKDPEFNVICDKLTAFLKHDDKAASNAKPAVAPVKAPLKEGAPKPEKESKGGLEKAIAEMNGDGRVVITQEKVDADGKVNRSVARAKKAVYEASTGDITLTGMPNVQQGFNMCMALEEGTVMVLNREGRMRVNGPTKTVIKDTNSDTPVAGGARKPSPSRELPPQTLIPR